MFYFQQLFNTAMNGIDSGGATSGAVQVAQYVLLASLLFGVYEAWARGGDTHYLGATALRFFAIGLVLINYGSVFRDVNGMFNGVANFIDSSTASGIDVFGQWMNDLSTYWSNNNGIQALWGLITGAFSGVLESFCCLSDTSFFRSLTRSSRCFTRCMARFSTWWVRSCWPSTPHSALDSWQEPIWST